MNRGGRHRQPTLPGTIGVVLLGTGVIAWAWTGDWRWIVVGVCLLVILACLGAYIDGRSN